MLTILPSVAQSYPWIKIYSTEHQGFSLSTLYRNMEEFGDFPIMLLICDVLGHVFGVFCSHKLKPNPNYYGTSNACLMFRFEGAFPKFG